MFCAGFYRQQNDEICEKGGTEVPPFYVPSPLLIRGDRLLCRHNNDFMHGLGGKGES